MKIVVDTDKDQVIRYYLTDGEIRFLHEISSIYSKFERQEISEDEILDILSSKESVGLIPAVWAYFNSMSQGSREFVLSNEDMEFINKIPPIFDLYRKMLQKFDSILSTLGPEKDYLKHEINRYTSLSLFRFGGRDIRFNESVFHALPGHEM